jgi:hypothetical protein
MPDDADEPSPTEKAADVFYWLLYHGERLIHDDGSLAPME